MVSVIIPAFNEEATIRGIVLAALTHPSIEEVIVVDDGSKDKTAQIAEKAGAQVIRLRKKAGKAEAMDMGVQYARSNILLFLDADVIGYTKEKISRIIYPVILEEREMYVAVRARKMYIMNKLLGISPILGGERALTRSLWNSVPKNHKKGFEIEIALNYAAKQTSKGMGFELVYGIRHVIKEKKYGIFYGFWHRVVMSYEVMHISFIIYILGTVRQILEKFWGSFQKV
jgi:glycosyltransferase involved in cell wall biosynthesis